MTETNKLTADQFKAIIETQALLVSGDFDLDGFMQVVADRVLTLTAATGSAVELVEGSEMVYMAVSGSLAEHIGLRLQIAGSLSGHCVNSGKIAVSEDTSIDSRVNVAACRKAHIASMIVVPLYRKRLIVGVLKVASRIPRAFDSQDLNTLELMAGLLGGALGQQLEIRARQELEDRLRVMAQHDALTGLPNRALFYDRLDQAVARARRGTQFLAVMYVDLDRFKRVNDTYGHAAGDALLRQFAERVGKFVRASDTLARLGGDEFSLIIENLPGKAEAALIATKIITAASTPFLIENIVLKVGASVGIALAGSEVLTGTELLQRADEALYEAKRGGRGSFAFAQIDVQPQPSNSSDLMTSKPVLS